MIGPKDYDEMDHEEMKKKLSFQNNLDHKNSSSSPNWSSNFDLETNVVNLTYKNCIFDPISVRSNEDIKHVHAYFKHKITEREMKDQSENGRKSIGSKYYASSEVIRYGFEYRAQSFTLN